MLFRFTASSGASGALAAILGLIGLGMLLGTRDEYAAGRAFDRALVHYAAKDFESAELALDEATDAKADYTAPLEVKGKLLVDQGRATAAKYKEAQELFAKLRQTQETTPRRIGGRTLSGPSIAVLIGEAVAQFEASRAADPSREPSEDAVGTAEEQLARALKQAEENGQAAGDVYINLATVALHDGKAEKCRAYLDKAREVGNISIDALPYLYNLEGVLEHRRGKLTLALEEFDKVDQFDPDWAVPRVNRAAVLARSLTRGKLDDATAERYEREILKSASKGADSAKHLIYPIHHSLAIHYMRKGQFGLAIKQFEQAADHSELGWKATLNRGVARYVKARREGGSNNPLYQSAYADLKRLVVTASQYDHFVAHCMLGTIDALAGNTKPAIDAFTKAELIVREEATTDDKRDAALRAALPRVQLSLAALLVRSGQPEAARDVLRRLRGETPESAKGFLAQFGVKPGIESFRAWREKGVYTDFDLRVQAHVQCRSSAAPLTKDDIKLQLHNTLTGDVRDIPFTLYGPDLRAVVLNLPQGTFRTRITVTDALGNRNTQTSPEQPIRIDREGPRITHQKPGPGGVVQGTAGRALSAIEFQLHDAVGKVDFGSLRVRLKRTESKKWRTLVQQGRCVPSGEAVKPDAPGAEKTIRAPLPKPTSVGGSYQVEVRVADTQRRPAETTWTFRIE